jgi:hypothetical protein
MKRQVCFLSSDLQLGRGLANWSGDQTSPLQVLAHRAEAVSQQQDPLSAAYEDGSADWWP